ncbi:restriction endonuclease subunit S [Neisseria subflava]|uniref:restriction endonuclease subunit S n=1 Tax=Neisseria subflava TaxID=28449 RepID=UPI000D32062A|nr:restriction endonuclease subunit S [Neisseria subflava]
MNKQQEPRLRFKGFTGTWEEKKIGKIFNVTSGTTPLRSNQNYFSNGVINWVKTTDLNNSILDKTEEKISEIALNETSLKVLPKNTLFVAMYGGFNQIGRTGLLNMEATCNQALAAILPDKSQNPFYLLTYLNYSVEYWKGIAASSRKDPNITKQDVLDFECFFPSLPEQTHLSLFFRHLDRQIAESRAVLEKSRQLKKAMLAKMFPTNGEKIPEIRFKGFDGEWEYRKLGEVASSYSGGTPSVGNSKFYGGNIPFIRSGEIHSSKTELFLTQEGLENSSAKLVKQGDILYALYGATSGEVERSKINGAINQAILAIIPNENYDAEFISQWLKNNKENIVNLYLQGGQGNLSGEIVKKIEISFPTKKEQTAIGNFFRQLDETIALQTAEVEKLNQLKKGMLAAMLV